MGPLDMPLARAAETCVAFNALTFGCFIAAVVLGSTECDALLASVAATALYAAASLCFLVRTRMDITNQACMHAREEPVFGRSATATGDVIVVVAAASYLAAAVGTVVVVIVDHNPACLVLLCGTCPPIGILVVPVIPAAIGAVLFTTRLLVTRVPCRRGGTSTV